jgi:hypothetical protein
MSWLLDLITKLFNAVLHRQPAIVVEAEKAGAAAARLASETQNDDIVEKALRAAAAVRTDRLGLDGVRNPAAAADPDCRDCKT